MREIINYLIEANLGLLLFLAFYKLFLGNESSFRFMRFFLLTAIVFSLCFPLIHISNDQQVSLPTISGTLPDYWLPEVAIYGPEEVAIAEVNQAYNFWQIAGWIYGVGVVLFLGWLIVQLLSFLLTIRKAEAYNLHQFKIIESVEDKPTFSFFNVIYIGRANALSASEKQQIIIHESVHASQWHSLDILLVSLLQILFWFNPFIKIYKKIFIKLHEFEADAHAVENSDVNTYCSLLAKVALQNAQFPIASHFNHSLTIKRIEMMRTIRKKIRLWKVAVIALVMPVMFFIISCQDQVNEIAKSTITQTSDYPAEVKVHMDEYLKKHPDAKLTYMEGLPDEMDKMLASPQIKDRVIYNYTLKKEEGLKKGVLLKDITQYAENLQTEDKVFMIVEQQPEFPGGIDALKNFLRDNLKYPAAAAAAKIEGLVYISFVINTDGSVSDAKVLKGVEASLDHESIRVVSMFPKWIPGKQNGKEVRVRFNIPIKWSTENANAAPGTIEVEFSQKGISPDPVKMSVSYSKSLVNGKVILEGQILDEQQKGLPGANIVIRGTTRGTATDARGKFRLEAPERSGTMVFSFVGFETQIVNY